MQLDLNLLTALDALLEEESVTGAADRSGVSTPAMSRTLGRIRKATGDDILVRTGHAMVPTPFAVEIRARVAEVVAQSRALLSPRRELDLAGLTRTFGIVAHDAALEAIAADLVSSVRREAPGVALRLLGESAGDTQDLARGRVDLELSGTRSTLPSIHTETVSRHPLVVAMGTRHPLAARSEITVEEYAAASYVTVSRRGRLRDPFDEFLGERGLARRVVASLPTLAAALDVVRGGEVLAVVTAGGAQREGIVTGAMPVEWPAASMNMSWHRRSHDDQAHRWLRSLVRGLLSGEGASRGEPLAQAAGSTSMPSSLPGMEASSLRV